MVRSHRSGLPGCLGPIPAPAAYELPIDTYVDPLGIIRLGSAAPGVEPMNKTDNMAGSRIFFIVRFALNFVRLPRVNANFPAPLTAQTISFD